MATANKTCAAAANRWFATVCDKRFVDAAGPSSTSSGHLLYQSANADVLEYAHGTGDGDGDDDALAAHHFSASCPDMLM
jgi:hypothetical protein